MFLSAPGKLSITTALQHPEGDFLMDKPGNQMSKTRAIRSKHWFRLKTAELKEILSLQKRHGKKNAPAIVR
jgi:hypothetical protein